MKNGKLNHDNQYNEEPVYYCESCLSLKILNYSGIVDCYCGECTSTRIAQCNIQEWEKLYEQKYGYKFLNKK